MRLHIDLIGSEVYASAIVYKYLLLNKRYATCNTISTFKVDIQCPRKQQLHDVVVASHLHLSVHDQSKVVRSLLTQPCRYLLLFALRLLRE